MGKELQDLGRLNLKFVKGMVNVVIGSFDLKMTDLILCDLGENFVLTRSYKSLCENHHQPLGSRWLLNLGCRLEQRENQIRILMDDFHIKTFEPKGGIYGNRRGGDRSLVLTKEKHGYSLKFIHQQKNWDFNEFGRLIAMRDRCGNRVTIEYIGSFISYVTLGSGRMITFAYENDKIVEIRDMVGRTTRYKYQGDLLNEVTYPDDGTVKYEYTDRGFIKAVIDQNGQRCVVNEYDGEGRVIRQTLANGGETLFSYQEQDRLTTVFQPHNGKRTCYYYNRRNLVEKIVYIDKTTEETKYDDRENIICKKDRQGHETRYIYNKASQLVEEQWPDGLVHTIEYDAADRKIVQKDAGGVDIRYRYDGRGNLIEIRSRIEGERWQTISYTYDAKGRKTSETDGNGHVTHYDYRERESRPWLRKTAEGDTFTYHYDAAERLMVAENALGRKEYGYTNLDYQALETDALGNTWKYEYDKFGNLTKEVRPNQFSEKSHNGPGWHYTYDALDKRVTATDPLGNVLATLRDAEENAIKEINPNTYDPKTKDGTGIENEYDTDNRKIKICYPDGGIERLKYDANGNLIKKIQPADYDEVIDDGSGYTYEYDARNRLIKITNPEGLVEKAYVYNLAGNLVKEIDAVGYSLEDTDETRPGTLYRYNCLNWLTEKRVPVSQANGQIRYQLTEYKYDNAGNVIEERRHIDEQDEASTSGRVLSIYFAYDKQNRLKEVRDNTGAVIEYGYNCLNQRIYEKRKINDNTYQILRYRYDAAGRLVETEQRADREGSGDFTARTTYELDKTGNVTKITTPAGYCVERQYDDADRLIAEIHIDKENGIENKTEFTYDKAGNIVKVKDNNGAEETYEYDLLNRETKYTGKNGGITRTVYDKNGRIIKRILPNEYQIKGEAGQGCRYTYDRQGRVITIIAPDGSVIETNRYDTAGRLLKRRDSAQSGVDYTYDLAGRIKTIHTPGGACQAYEYDVRGNIIAVIDGNKIKTEYKLDRWGRTTEIVKADGTREYYGYDYAGNITETTDGEGNTIRYEYNLINKLKEITDQTGEKDTFLYDAEGRLKFHTDRNGTQVEYSYNIYDALTEKLERSSGLREIYEYHPEETLREAIHAKDNNGYTDKKVTGLYSELSNQTPAQNRCQYDGSGNQNQFCGPVQYTLSVNKHISLERGYKFE
jgi:YD repeat-containing protein